MRYSELSFWREAVLQRTAGHPEVGCDRYRWALRFSQSARKRHGIAVGIQQVLDELADGWKKYGGPDGLTLEQAQEAIHSAWHRSDSLTADAVANHAGFKEPPTFANNGTLVPRNIDEANS